MVFNKISVCIEVRCAVKKAQQLKTSCELGVGAEIGPNNLPVTGALNCEFNSHQLGSAGKAYFLLQLEGQGKAVSRDIGKGAKNFKVR